MKEPLLFRNEDARVHEVHEYALELWRAGLSPWEATSGAWCTTFRVSMPAPRGGTVATRRILRRSQELGPLKGR